MEFWNETVTGKSWNMLVRLRKMDFRFVLIGGWAAYLWTKKNKSKDVDIVLEDVSVLDFLKNNFDMKKNAHLKKYEIKTGDIDVDVYVPYYSRLAIPPEDMKKHATVIDGISVATVEALLLLKQGAETDRGLSQKGLKDRIDMMALLCFCDVNFKKYREMLESYGRPELMKRLRDIVSGFTEMKYLGLNPRELKLKKMEIMEKLRAA